MSSQKTVIRRGTLDLHCSFERVGGQDGSPRGRRNTWTASALMRLLVEVEFLKVERFNMREAQRAGGQLAEGVSEFPLLDDAGACRILAKARGVKPHLLQKKLIDARKYHAGGLLADAINGAENSIALESLLRDWMA